MAAQKSVGDKYRQFQRMIPALDPDRWCPAFDGGKVRLAVYLYPNAEMVRLTAWGADDTGLEKGFKGSVAECEQFYSTWVRYLSGLSVFSWDLARSLGFE